MRATKSVIFGFASLVCTVNATMEVGQSPITLSSKGCTVICEMTDEGGKSCQAFCSGSIPPFHPATPPPTSTSTVMTTVTSATKSLTTDDGSDVDCENDCWNTPEGLRCVTSWSEDDADCMVSFLILGMDDVEGTFICRPQSSTSVPPTATHRAKAAMKQRVDSCLPNLLDSVPATSTPTATLSSKAALKQRGVTITSGDCTALCWDLMPGTECDVQCSSDLKTEMPVPTKAAVVVSFEARENLQVQKVREARLARKFGGNVARDDNQKMTTITSYQVASETAWKTSPEQLFELNESKGIAAVLLESQLSYASAAMSEATAAPVSGSTAAELASAASSLLAEVISSKTASTEAPFTPAVMSLAAAWKTILSVVPLPVFPNATVAAPASTGFAPTVTATRTFNVSTATFSANGTAIYNSSKTTTASTTTTEALVVSQVGTPAGNYNTYGITTTFNGAPQYIGSSGLVWSLLVGLAANVAFLI